MRRRARADRTRTRQSPPQGRRWWRVLIVIVAGALVYANNLSGPFVFDDQESIVRNGAVRDLSRVWSVTLQRDTPIAGRPLAALSFALNYATSDLTVKAYHLTNIAIHILCALLLYGIVRRTLSLARWNERFRDTADDLACATALVWVVHPLNSEVVNYLTERTESLMALCLLMTVYAAIRFATSSRRVLWAALSTMSCAAGMASKESMVVAPLLVVLYDRTFLYGSVREMWVRRWRFYGCLATTWLLLAYFMLPGPRSNSVGAAHVDPRTYLLNQAAMVVRYFRLALWPRGLVIDYGPAMPLDATSVWPQIALMLILVALTLVALVKWPGIGFLGLWVAMTLAPTSSVVPIATEVGAERRMYVPLMALAALAVVGLFSIDAIRLRVGRRGAIAGLAVVTLALALVTASRNRDYVSALSLAEANLRDWPTDVSHGMVGSELGLAGRNKEALEHLRIAARTDPRSRYNYGIELFNAGRYDEAIHELGTFAGEHPLLGEVPSARKIMGNAYALKHEWQRAINELRISLSMIPGDQKAQALLVDVYNRRGLELVDQGRLGDAVTMFQQGAKIDPQHFSVWHNMAAAMLDNRDPAGAERAARQAVALGPSDAGSHDLLGRALALQGRTGESIQQFEQALTFAPDDPQIGEDLRRVQALQR